MLEVFQLEHFSWMDTFSFFCSRPFVEGRCGVIMTPHLKNSLSIP
jgi:hypothetical protein